MGGAPIRVRRFGLIEYGSALERMRAFTAARTHATPDEIWLLEHHPVYTLGVRARHRQLHPPQGVAVAITDRGGDVTYHGPGQPVIYVLVDLIRRGLDVQELVRVLEQAVIDVLAGLDVPGERRPGAPGVYVGERKIASLGLRVRAGRTYHGLSFNVRMDLAPFHAIDPCGYPGLRMAQLAEWHSAAASAEAGEQLLSRVLRLLGYTETSSQHESPSEIARPVDARQ